MKGADAVVFRYPLEGGTVETGRGVHMGIDDVGGLSFSPTIQTVEPLLRTLSAELKGEEVMMDATHLDGCNIMLGDMFTPESSKLPDLDLPRGGHSRPSVIPRHGPGNKPEPGSSSTPVFTSMPIPMSNSRQSWTLQYSKTWDIRDPGLLPNGSKVVNGVVYIPSKWAWNASTAEHVAISYAVWYPRGTFIPGVQLQNYYGAFLSNQPYQLSNQTVSSATLATIIDSTVLEFEGFASGPAAYAKFTSYVNKTNATWAVGKTSTGRSTGDRMNPGAPTPASAGKVPGQTSKPSATSSGFN